MMEKSRYYLAGYNGIKGSLILGRTDFAGSPGWRHYYDNAIRAQLRQLYSSLHANPHDLSKWGQYDALVDILLARCDRDVR